MSTIECPACGETEDLRGESVDALIHLVCERCGQEWDRDPSPRCPTCGADDLFPALKAIVEKSRGSQLSVVATEVVHLCLVCDAELLGRYRISRSPLMPDDLPTEGGDT